MRVILNLEKTFEKTVVNLSLLSVAEGERIWGYIINLHVYVNISLLLKMLQSSEHCSLSLYENRACKTYFLFQRCCKYPWKNIRSILSHFLKVKNCPIFSRENKEKIVISDTHFVIWVNWTLMTEFKGRLTPVQITVWKAQRTTWWWVHGTIMCWLEDWGECMVAERQENGGDCRGSGRGMVWNEISHDIVMWKEGRKWNAWMNELRHMYH